MRRALAVLMGLSMFLSGTASAQQPGPLSRKDSPLSWWAPARTESYSGEYRLQGSGAASPGFWDIRLELEGRAGTSGSLESVRIATRLVLSQGPVPQGSSPPARGALNTEVKVDPQGMVPPRPQAVLLNQLPQSLWFGTLLPWPNIPPPRPGDSGTTVSLEELAPSRFVSVEWAWTVREEGEYLRISMRGRPPGNEVGSLPRLEEARMEVLVDSQRQVVARFQREARLRVALPGAREGEQRVWLELRSQGGSLEGGGIQEEGETGLRAPVRRPPQADACWDVASHHPSLQVPSLSLKDESGKYWNLNELRGRPLVLEFWASWCGPCMASLPHLISLSRSWEKQGLQVLAVNLDDTREAAQEAEKALGGLPFPVILKGDEAYGAVADAQYTAIPLTILIDKEGKMAECLAGYGGPEPLEAALDRLMGGKRDPQ